MKSKALTIIAITTAVSFQVCFAALQGGLQAPLPDFQKNNEQLAHELSSQHPLSSAEKRFYTGKPFDAAKDGFVFAYREYIPELGRWTTADPSGYPNGANSSIYCVNSVTLGLDPNGLAFLHFNGSSITYYDGGGWQSNGTIDWGTAGQSWAAVSGGADGANALPGLDRQQYPAGLWYSVGEKKAPAGYDDSLAIGNRSEADFTYNGIKFQGTMSAWQQTGYGDHQGPYSSTNYGYDPNDTSDAQLGTPVGVQYKFLLSGIHGNSISVSDGYRIHPKDITITHGCLGLQGYDAAKSFEEFMANHANIELYVE